MAGAAVPGMVAKTVERLDLAIYAVMDHERFKSVKVAGRSIMATVGEVRYRRRCYADNIGERYVWPANSVLGIPSRAKVSAELKRDLVLNASEMTHSMAARHSSLSGQVSKATEILQRLYGKK